MESILLTGDELKRFETRFGPVGRKMGSWNSDGIFGYASVSIIAAEKAAEAFANPVLLTALPRLRTSEGTRTCVELLEDLGPALVERIVDASRGCSNWPHPSVLMHSRKTS
jgi:hypothetical protein